jgi:hypothetical protein
MAASTFKQKRPRLAGRAVLGLVMGGLVRPAVWILERLALTERVVGTNGMMQIANQLVPHGHAEFDHIQCVVAWPDISAGGPMRR